MEATTIDKSERASIGLNPLIRTPAIIFGPNYIAWKAFDLWGANMFVIWFGIWLFLFFFCLVSIPNCIRGYFYHRAARRAINRGEINPSTVIRGFNCVGTAMFDPKARKAFINGTIYDYRDIETIGWQSGSDRAVVTFNLKVGKKPFQKVKFAMPRNVEMQYQIAANALS